MVLVLSWMSPPLISNFPTNLSTSCCKIEELKKKVRRKLMGTTDEWECMRTIDSLHRLDIARHFDHEIETRLSSTYHKLCGRKTHHDHDLNAAALRFRLLRQRRFSISPDVFQKFKDDEGRFDLRWTKDAGRLMSLYEAAQFEHPGEDTLDEAKTFAKTHLRALVPFLEPSQAKQVEHVLQHPFHMSLPRIEARRYIETFRHGCELTEQHMVDLAILDFNHVQSIHQTDLQEFSRWWEEIGVAKAMGSHANRNLPFLWFMLSAVTLPEPQFSRCRIELAKLSALVVVIDDLYDLCEELEHLVLFTEAVNSWGRTSVEQLPNYMKLCFRVLQDVVENGTTFLAVKSQDRIYLLHHFRAMWGSVCKAFLREARWCRLGVDTPTSNDYLENATMSTGLILHLFYAYFHLQEQHLSTMRPLIHASIPSLIYLPATIFRLWNDQVKRDRGHDASYVEFHMKEHNVSEEYARQETMNLIGESWKKLNLASESHPHHFPPAFISFAFNSARIGQLLYESGTDDQEMRIKEHVRKMLVEQVQV